MIYAENRKPLQPQKYEGSFAQELGIEEDKWVDTSQIELHTLLGYKGEEWRLRMQNEHIGNAMWDESGYESQWTEFDTEL